MHTGCSLVTQPASPLGGRSLAISRHGNLTESGWKHPYVGSRLEAGVGGLISLPFCTCLFWSCSSYTAPGAEQLISGCLRLDQPSASRQVCCLVSWDDGNPYPALIICPPRLAKTPG